MALCCQGSAGSRRSLVQTIVGLLPPSSLQSLPFGWETPNPLARLCRQNCRRRLASSCPKQLLEPSGGRLRTWSRLACLSRRLGACARALALRASLSLSLSYLYVHIWNLSCSSVSSFLISNLKRTNPLRVCSAGQGLIMYTTKSLAPMDKYTEALQK